MHFDRFLKFLSRALPHFWMLLSIFLLLNFLTIESQRVDHQFKVIAYGYDVISEYYEVTCCQSHAYSIRNTNSELIAPIQEPSKNGLCSEW